MPSGSAGRVTDVEDVVTLAPVFGWEDAPDLTLADGDTEVLRAARLRQATRHSAFTSKALKNHSLQNKNATVYLRRCFVFLVNSVLEIDC